MVLFIHAIFFVKYVCVGYSVTAFMPLNVLMFHNDPGAQG